MTAPDCLAQLSLSLSLGKRSAMSFNAISFETFLKGWLVRQGHYLDELLTAQQYCHESSDDYLNDLISRVLSHYQQYYDEKSRVAGTNVFLMFSPSWFSSFEQSFLWIAGFKPGLAFQLVASSVRDLSVEQGDRLSRLREETRVAERELAEELATIQESVAAPPLLEAARRAGRGGHMESGAVERLRVAMKAALTRADILRTSTAARVVEILSPAQGVKFLAAATQLQLKIRALGLRKDAERRVHDDSW